MNSVSSLQATEQNAHDQVAREYEEDVGPKCGAWDLQAGMRRHNERYGEATEPFNLRAKRGLTRVAGGALHACSMGHSDGLGCAKVRP